MEPRASEIRPREVWATDRPALAALASEDVRFLLVHHSASPNSYAPEEVPSILRGFYDYHTGPEKQWNDIAYNFLIDRFGGIWEGRTGSVAGPVAGDATGGNQGFSQLICLIGDFTTETPPEQALNSLVALLAWLATRYQVSTRTRAEVTFESGGSNRWPAGAEVKTTTIAGHRDMSLTSCPGNALYAYVKGDLPRHVEAVRAAANPVTTAETTSTTTGPARPSSQSADGPATTATTGERAAGSRRATAVKPDDQTQPWTRNVAASLAIALVGVVIRRRMVNSPGDQSRG